MTKTKRALTTIGIVIMAGALLFLMMLVGPNTAQAQNHDGTKPLFSKCSIEYRYDGIWWHQCPRDSLVQGVDGSVNPPFLNLRVRCVKLVITCEDPITREPIRIQPIDMDVEQEL